MMMAMHSTARPVWFSAVLAIDTTSGIADGHGQRRVLGQVQVLVGQRRDDHAQRLRQDHQAHRACRATARGCRPPRPGRARTDWMPRAHHLGDEGRGVHHQAEQHRQELRRRATPPSTMKAPLLGHAPAPSARRRRPSPAMRQADDDASGTPRTGCGRGRSARSGAAPSAASTRPTPMPTQQAGRHPGLARAPDRHREREAALAQEEQVGDVPRASATAAARR